MRGGQPGTAPHVEHPGRLVKPGQQPVAAGQLPFFVRKRVVVAVTDPVVRDRLRGFAARPVCALRVPRTLSPPGHPQYSPPPSPRIPPPVPPPPPARHL